MHQTLQYTRTCGTEEGHHFVKVGEQEGAMWWYSEMLSQSTDCQGSGSRVGNNLSKYIHFLTCCDTRHNKRYTDHCDNGTWNDKQSLMVSGIRTYVRMLTLCLHVWYADSFLHEAKRVPAVICKKLRMCTSIHASRFGLGLCANEAGLGIKMLFMHFFICTYI